MKKLIALILLLALFAASVFGCAYEAPNDEPDKDTQDEIEKELEDEDKQEEEYYDPLLPPPGEKSYHSIPFANETYLDDGRINLEKPVVIVASTDELSQLDPNNKLNFKDKYTSDFFETTALILAKFVHPSTNQFIELSGIVVKDGKLCPVMTGWYCPYANGNADCYDSIIYAEISRDYIMEPGELYALNIWDLDAGIPGYEPLDGKLWRYSYGGPPRY